MVSIADAVSLFQLYLLHKQTKVKLTLDGNCWQATAVFAADALARLSGTVGVAAVTAGPGTVLLKFMVQQF